MDILSVLTSWSLEGSVMTADSMRSRGYGSGKRSNFSIYRITKRDIIMAIVLAAAISLVCIGAAGGSTSIEYYPTIIMSELNAYSVIGMAGYLLLLLTPTVVDISEEILWRILRSKI